MGPAGCAKRNWINHFSRCHRYQKKGLLVASWATVLRFGGLRNRRPAIGVGGSKPALHCVSPRLVQSAAAQLNEMTSDRSTVAFGLVFLPSLLFLSHHPWWVLVFKHSSRHSRLLPPPPASSSLPTLPSSLPPPSPIPHTSHWKMVHSGLSSGGQS